MKQYRLPLVALALLSLGSAMHTRASENRTVDELATFEGELWTSRPRDGRFDRLLPGPGPYAVRAVPEGGEAVEETVVVDGGVVEVELVLPR